MSTYTTNGNGATYTTISDETLNASSRVVSEGVTSYVRPEEKVTYTTISDNTLNVAPRESSVTRVVSEPQYVRGSTQAISHEANVTYTVISDATVGAQSRVYDNHHTTYAQSRTVEPATTYYSQSRSIIHEPTVVHAPTYTQSTTNFHDVEKVTRIVVSEYYRRRLQRFFQKYDQSKLGSVDSLLIENYYKEPMLIFDLVKQYGEEPAENEVLPPIIEKKVLMSPAPAPISEAQPTFIEKVVHLIEERSAPAKSDQEEAPKEDEKKEEEAPKEEEKKEEEAPAAEEKKEEEAPAVEEKKEEEAPAVEEEKKEEAPAAEEEKKEEAPAVEEKEDKPTPKKGKKGGKK